MLKVADLFCGMGGLSLGFAENGFSVLGYDHEEFSQEIFSKNSIGNVIVQDLRDTTLTLNADVIIGGPPCRPWSTVNLSRRKVNHKDYDLIDTFFKTVTYSSPAAFVMENVPQLKKDSIYQKNVESLKGKYFVDNLMVSYLDYGAATTRKRLITFGFMEEKKTNHFKEMVSIKTESPKTVGDMIRRYEGIEKEGYPDHTWPDLKTINKYNKLYETGKYGWYKLNMDEPAPSFGNVMKTYTLHPSGTRVVSIREVMSIMGFPGEFSFPDKMGKRLRYQMVADVVSPNFSYVCASILKEILTQ